MSLVRAAKLNGRDPRAEHGKMRPTAGTGQEQSSMEKVHQLSSLDY